MTSKGYEVKEDKILFIHDNDDADEVYVVGNFMGWKEKDDEWKMDYNSGRSRWELLVDIETIRKSNVGFYEFTFIVDGEWIDADKDSDNVIHCPGYGYRYKIDDI
ncbi:MAG: glycogen-binding domain-containing protein [Thermoplasmatota archaeon]